MEHILYETGDPEAPDAIKDQNGEVVLALCKVCGRGEVELEEHGGACFGGDVVNYKADPEVEYNKQLRWSRRLSDVPRWCVVPVLRRQSVAEHTFHVTVIAHWLARRNARCGTNGWYEKILDAALYHDMDEAQTGDTPSTRKIPQPPKDQVKVVVKLADHLEAIVFLAEEARMGNQRTRMIEDEIRMKFHELWSAFEWGWPERKPLASDVIRAVVDECVMGHPAMEDRLDVPRG